MNRIATVPNLLTLLRLGCLPAVILLFRNGRHGAAAGIFVAAMITDGLDGWLARRLDQRTALGLYLDPVVDKIVVLALLYELGAAGTIHAAVPHLFLARELLQNAVRSVAAAGGTVVGANWMGKTKFVLETVLITWGLLAPVLPDLVSRRDLEGAQGVALSASAWIVLLAAWAFFAVFTYRNRSCVLGSEALR
jgi:CDP-diacylglycerol--glycerol-3-phosphate 3-phosphatidyltransferase